MGRPTRGAASPWGAAIARRWLRGQAEEAWMVTSGSFCSSPPAPNTVTSPPRPMRLSLPLSPFLPRSPPHESLLAAPPALSPTGFPPAHTPRAAGSRFAPLFRALQGTEPLSFVLAADDPFPPFPPLRPRRPSHPPVPPPSSRRAAREPHRARPEQGGTRTREPVPRPRRVCFPFLPER